MSISENRHHAQRIKNKRKKYYCADASHDLDTKDKETRIGKAAITPKQCNCWMCSNARKNHGKPFSEIRAEDVANSKKI